jgi:hypothetical protein
MKIEYHDDRCGLPSASNWRRYELCSASFQLEQEAKRLGQEAHKRSPEAERGERIHAWLAGEKIELEETELATATFLRERALGEVERIFGTLEVPCIREKRLWLERDGVKALSGRFDVVYFSKKLALCIDFKSGWREPDPAEQNAQLKVLAVLVGIALPSVEEVVVQLISGPYGVTEARYNLAALSGAFRDIVASLRKINDSAAGFSPSIEACRYCQANLICQATKDLVLPVAKLQHSALPDGDRAAKLLDECELLERHIDAIRAYYKERLETDPDYSVPGYSMVPGPQRRVVEDWKRARARLEEFIDPAQVEALANYSIPSLEKLLAKTLKLRAKDASAKLSEILGDLLSVKPGNLCLKRIKGEAKVAALVEP